MPDTNLRPVFVGGCPRSGTTMLGSMLGVGAEYLTVPEALFKFGLLHGTTGDDHQVDVQEAIERLGKDESFKRWKVPALAENQPSRLPAVELIEEIVEAFGRRTGKADPSVWVDHTPGNIRYAATLNRLFPTAKFINLVRDGRAVASSVLPLEWGPNTISEAAHWWASHIAVGLASERALGGERVLTVRYEDLVREPAEILGKLCAFLELSYDDRMIDSREYEAAAFSLTDQRLAGRPPDPTRTLAWKHKLSSSQVELFEHLTWELLDLLGYQMVFGAKARMAPRHERLTAFGQDVLRRGVTDRIRRHRRSRRGPNPAGQP